MANIGGILGLTMGCSLVTIFEVLHHVVLVFLRTSAKGVSRIHRTMRCHPTRRNDAVVGVGGGNGNIDGNTLERQSKLSGSLLLTYSGTLGNAVGLYSNVDLNYQDKQYLEALNLGTTSDRTLLNARVGLEKGRWDVSLWSRNLLDEKYVSNSFVVFFANSCVASLGDARSFGLTVRYRL